MKLMIDSRGNVWITKLGERMSQQCPLNVGWSCGLYCPLCRVKISDWDANVVRLQLCHTCYSFDKADVTIEAPFKLQGD